MESVSGHGCALGAVGAGGAARCPELCGLWQRWSGTDAPKRVSEDNGGAGRRKQRRVGQQISAAARRRVRSKQPDTRGSSCSARRALLPSALPVFLSENHKKAEQTALPPATTSAARPRRDGRITRLLIRKVLSVSAL